MDTSIARRIGALTALPPLTEGDEPAVALGDPAARHVRVRSDGLQPAFGQAPSGFVPWTHVRTVTAEVPTTWWPHPALGDTIVPLIEGVFGGSSDSILETPTFSVLVTTTDGAEVAWQATPHYLSGYRRRDATLANRLLHELITVPESRTLLTHPDDLLTRLAEILGTR